VRWGFARRWSIWTIVWLGTAVEGVFFLVAGGLGAGVEVCSSIWMSSSSLSLARGVAIPLLFLDFLVGLEDLVLVFLRFFFALVWDSSEEEDSSSNTLLSLIWVSVWLKGIVVLYLPIGSVAPSLSDSSSSSKSSVSTLCAEGYFPCSLSKVPDVSLSQIVLLK
jgi:hypothetical protein